MTNIFLQKINAIVKFQKLLNYEDFEKLAILIFTWKVILEKKSNDGVLN